MTKIFERMWVGFWINRMGQPYRPPHTAPGYYAMFQTFASEIDRLERRIKELERKVYP